MPFSSPMEVIPICTVDRNRVGSSASFTAAAARRVSLPGEVASRGRRAVSSATSDMAKTPFRRIRQPESLAPWSPQRVMQAIVTTFRATGFKQLRI